VCDCSALFDNSFLQDNVNDKWSWGFDHNGDFSIKKSYQLLSQGEDVEHLTSNVIILE